MPLEPGEIISTLKWPSLHEYCHPCFPNTSAYNRVLIILCTPVPYKLISAARNTKATFGACKPFNRESGLTLK